jgi:hypothetical protein
MKPTNVYKISSFLILCVKKSTYLVEMYGELGLQPFSVLRKFRIIKYWAQILQHTNYIQFNIYLMLREDYNGGATYNMTKIGYLMWTQIAKLKLN